MGRVSIVVTVSLCGTVLKSMELMIINNFATLLNSLASERLYQVMFQKGDAEVVLMPDGMIILVCPASFYVVARFEES
jgi:hypothetical protein